jgi:hypothetical protein
MSQEYIEIRGAPENNLKDVSLRIPKRNITIFTGVSGSGKSSIVFDTIATALSVDQARQFLTLYQALQAFDERAGQTRINCPGLCLVGSADEMQYGAQWGNVHVSIVGPIVAGRAELEGLGWDVQLLEGLDHMQAMQASQVVPLLRWWLGCKLASR